MPLYSQDATNRTVQVELNLTINNTNELGGNITNISITLPLTAVFTLDTNYTDSPGTNSNFTNLTEPNGQQVLLWSHADSLISNTTENGTGSTVQSFIFNATFATAGQNTITINASHFEGGQFSNETTIDIWVDFEFSGYIRNETGDYQNNTNVTMYRFDAGVGGPPAETALEYTTSDGSGFFRFPSLNGSAPNYLIKFVLYNNGTDDTEGNATKVGTTLPPFPANMYYPVYGLEEFDMGLNGSTFYLQEAATLNLSATNTTGDSIKFGYMITDQLLGFPVESSIMESVMSKEIIVPTGRDYTIMMVREPTQFVRPGIDCSDAYLNETDCATPPKSVSIVSSNLTGGDVLNVDLNLSISKIYVYGCIDVAEGNNNSLWNVTNIIPRLLPWSGFVVTGMKADDGSLNVSANTTIYNPDGNDVVDCGNFSSFYNISLLGNSEYMLEFYAKNGSLEEDHSNGAWDLAAFQNISTGTSDFLQNITLYTLAGDYNETAERNTSFMTVNIQNATGDAITTNIGHLVVKIKHSVSGTVSYIIESTTNGTFTTPILNNSNWAKVFVFSQNSPPSERTLNLSASENNITLISVDFDEGGDKGLRTTNSTGDFVTLNSSAYNLELEFFSTRSGCDVIEPAESCLITEMNSTSFNPLKALVAGKVNMRLKFTTSGTSLFFWNFDMFSAKQPPMSSVINTDPLASSSNSQTWEFGSFAPVDSYKNVTIVTSYSDDSSVSTYIDDSQTVNIKIPLLYVEDPSNQNAWLLAWNRTAGYTDANLTDDLIEYNETAFRSFLTADGIGCSTTDTTSVCFINTTSNRIYMTIPHFSGAGPSVSGSTAAATTSTTSSTGSSLTTTETWKKTIILSTEEFTTGATKELGTSERVRFTVEGKDHQVGVLEVTTDKVKIKVSSEPQEATLSIGEEKKFEVTNDTFYDISVKLNSITGTKASLTFKSIHEEIPTTPTEGGEALPEEAPPTPTEEEKPSLGWLWIIIIVVVVIVIVVIVILVKRKR